MFPCAPSLCSSLCLSLLSWFCLIWKKRGSYTLFFNVSKVNICKHLVGLQRGKYGTSRCVLVSHILCLFLMQFISEGYITTMHTPLYFSGSLRHQKFGYSWWALPHKHSSWMLHFVAQQCMSCPLAWRIWMMNEWHTCLQVIKVT